MATRESINRVKIEGWRVSRVPVNASEDIYQGDLLCWDSANKRATRLTTAASGANFVGMSDTKNSIETAGSSTFLSASTTNKVNVIQQGLVEVIWGANETIYPFDTVAISGTDAQTCQKSASNVIGFVDPAYGSAGKAAVTGELIRIWLKVADSYRAMY
jgi:hypothetical protein